MWIRQFLYMTVGIVVVCSTAFMAYLHHTFPNAVTHHHYEPPTHHTTATPTTLLKSVSFIVPTRGRDTLRRTIDSLLNQTLQIDFEILIAMDMMHQADVNMNDETLFPSYSHEPRVRYLKINTMNDTDRGEYNNGAGQIRNHIIQHYATKQYVAFCDDDDTLSPLYLEWLDRAITLHHGQQQSNMSSFPDLVLFRLHWPSKGGMPPIANVDIFPFQNDTSTRSRRIQLRMSRVGISFAVFRTSHIGFETSHAEDYQYLYRFSRSKLSMLVSPCMAYFVRTEPLGYDDDAYCHYNLFDRVSVRNPPKDMQYIIQHKR